MNQKSSIKIYTIGYTKKSAEKFFDLIRNEDISTLIDVRLNNTSQLSAFAKKDDLEFFLHELCAVQYLHIPQLAPTQNILKAYKSKSITWEDYEKEYLKLLSTRDIDNIIQPDILNKSCFLCSEYKPDNCHRRLAVEYLVEYFKLDAEVKHLI
ncbi:DUF488 family protein [Desulfamplus magnetovallimortis]|nr:DUF488 domain-containing protein [Desulfamplus magnetovallimortis]